MRLTLLAPLLALPLSAQAWDLRLEVPFPKGQNLPQTLIQGAVDTYRAEGRLDTGKGFTATVNHRLLRVGPILRLDWGVEVARWKSTGVVEQAGSPQNTRRFDSELAQTGIGVGLHAHLSVPFTPITGEFGVIQRLQTYKFQAAGTTNDHTLSRTWMRVGTRYILPLPLPVITPYICASYQQPLGKDRPVKVDNLSDLGTLLAAQGKGQEMDRMWSFGLGLTF